MLVSVAGDAGRNNQVDDGSHLLPVCLFVLGVLLLHRGNKLANERGHFLLKIAGQFCDKLHAVTSACLLIAFLQIIFDVLVRLTFILVDILLSDGDVRDD